MAGATFLECVAAVAAEERERAEAELIDIAYWSRASQGTISRFENGHSQPRDLDRLLLAYSKVCDVPAAELLRKAVDRWASRGGGAEHPLDQVAQELEAAAEEHEQPPARTARAGSARRRAGPTR